MLLENEESPAVGLIATSSAEVLRTQESPDGAFKTNDFIEYQD